MASAIPEDVSSLWNSLDPAIRAALIESEIKTNGDASQSKSKQNNNEGGGAQGRRALASGGPRMDETTRLIGGTSFVNRQLNPTWIKVRSDVYDAVKAKRDAELSGKTPVEIEVTLPDGKTMVEDKVRYYLLMMREENMYMLWCTPSYCAICLFNAGGLWLILAYYNYFF